MNAENTETDDCKTMAKTTTQIFQPRNMLKRQIYLNKNTSLKIYCLKRST